MIPEQTTAGNTSGGYFCSDCKGFFKEYDELINHKCPETGFIFNSVEHLDATSNGRFSLQSVKALERGAARTARKG